MTATEAHILDFLENARQFVIPIYQRAYSWTKRECQQLWDDILRTGSNDKIHGHFIGSIVYIEKDVYSVSNPSSLLVIDGQQRLTTVMLILEALARRLGDTEPIAGFSAEKIRRSYLTNHLGKGERLSSKLLLSKSDRQSFCALMIQQPVREDAGVVIDNFQFFEKKVKELADDFASLWQGLQKLLIIDIALRRNQDDPQLIFESMNSTGRGLSQTDLIRNFILMGLPLESQTRLYEHQWYPMEKSFEKAEDFDEFVRHYLSYKTQKYSKKHSLYEDFKEYARSRNSTEEGVECLVTEMQTFARYYSAMALDQESDRELRTAFRHLYDLGVKVYYPFLLELYDDYSHEHLNKGDFMEILHLIEVYIFRRGVCSIPSYVHRDTFLKFTNKLRKDRYLESVQGHFLTMRGSKRLPNDEEFMEVLKTRNLYNSGWSKYFLLRFENYGRKEIVRDKQYTIEHILPQNENLSDEWRQALGSDWSKVQEKYLHTLGNLSLTGYNSEYGDRPFREKRDMKGGFRDSPLRLNQGLGSIDIWNAEEIEKRAQCLAEESLQIWARPVLSEDILDMYRPQIGSLGYNFPDLEEGSPLRRIFNVLRNEILHNLDPRVKEGVYTSYINYKAGRTTIFMGMQPLPDCLRIDLRIPFHKLEDPRGMATDTTDMGTIPGLDAQVDLSKADDLPYVIGLIRQTFKNYML